MASQDVEYAKKVIGDLSSSEYHGRGYEYNGDKFAAKYIADELKKNGVLSFASDYLQLFSIKINTFPSEVKIKFGDKTPENGKDFIIDKISRGCNGKFELVWLDKITISKAMEMDLSKKFIVIDTSKIDDKKFKENFQAVKYINPLKAAGIIEIISKKPSSYQSQLQGACPVIQVINGVITSEMKALNISFKNKLEKNYKTQNVYGYVKGEVDSFIVIGSHYDHLGRMGNIFFPGANDNCSGVSMTLNLAKHFAQKENAPHYGIIFVFFTGEEVGLLGSDFFVNNAPVSHEKMKLMINLDLVGTGDDGITIVNGSVFRKEFELFTSINKEKGYLKEIKARGKAANSDHYPFSEKGISSFFIYTRGGVSEYHTVDDIAGTLPLTEYEDLFRLITDFIIKYE
ncbi:MAG: hypothetical protein A2W91_14825 [Bacteroidetes bacterium GWF2_38_335]|nr:MAG: hypothetical protein A2W91_14825 [Bacteroidetes bacterium GWF2_38_335]OFY78517.1 MAG: hypothetical protein A2281_16135 [Bacteroidetes bacterium RIFOXYA12_FULL_38_20]